MTLEEWNQKFGGDAGVDPFAGATPKRREGFDFQMDVAYPARIKRATVVKSNRGDDQIRLILGILDSDSPEAVEIGESVQYIDLPYNAHWAQMTDADKKARALRVAFDTLRRLYSAALPSDFAPYWKVEMDGKRKVYLDFDGTPLTNGKYDERDIACKDRVFRKLEWLKENIDATVEELTDAFLYVHKKPRADKPAYPYTNYYVTRPQRIPVYSGTDVDSSEVAF